jgi:hypothetical protein
MAVGETTPDSGNITQRKKMVNIGISFVCDTDAEALAVKERVNEIVKDNPAIQTLFSIVERHTTGA